MCLCSVCRTRVFFRCDNDTTVNHQPQSTITLTWKMNDSQSKKQRKKTTHTHEVGKQTKIKEKSQQHPCELDDE